MQYNAAVHVSFTESSTAFQVRHFNINDKINFGLIKMYSSKEVLF